MQEIERLLKLDRVKVLPDHTEDVVVPQQLPSQRQILSAWRMTPLREVSNTSENTGPFLVFKMELQFECLSLNGMLGALRLVLSSLPI